VVAPPNRSVSGPIMSHPAHSIRARSRSSQKLPASTQRVGVWNRVVVAFAVNARWVVRLYPEPGPKEVEDLRQALFPPDEPTEKSM
jgi:hypothetical protein